MINRVSLFLIILFTIISINSYSQEADDSIKLKERNDDFLNYENYRSSITDTTIEVLKKLNKFQTELIVSDNAIIHNYISTNTRKTEELKKNIILLNEEKDKSERKYIETNKWMFYAIIGAGIFIILAVLFFALFVISNNKKKKAFSQLIKIEKIKEEQLREINLLKNNLAAHPNTDQNEIQKTNEGIENDLLSQETRYNTLLNEKVQLENILSEKDKSLNELKEKQSLQDKRNNSEMIDLKNQYENQINQLKNDVNQLMQNSQRYDNNILEKEIQFNKKCNEFDKLNSLLSEYIELYEKEKTQRILIEERSFNSDDRKIVLPVNNENDFMQLKSEKADLENELYSLKQELEKEKHHNQEIILNQKSEPNADQNKELSVLLEENNYLKTELNKFKEQLQRENQLRIEIENEIKQIIDEIKGMRK